MPAHDIYHVVAIDFSPHTESMQTDALLETGMRSAGAPGDDDYPYCCDRGEKRMGWCMATVCGMVVLVIVLSNM